MSTRDATQRNRIGMAFLEDGAVPIINDCNTVVTTMCKSVIAKGVVYECSKNTDH